MTPAQEIYDLLERNMRREIPVPPPEMFFLPGSIVKPAPRSSVKHAIIAPGVIKMGSGSDAVHIIVDSAALSDTWRERLGCRLLNTFDHVYDATILIINNLRCRYLKYF